MKRHWRLCVVACLGAVIALIAWLRWSENESVDPPEVPYAMELAAGEASSDALPTLVRSNVISSISNAFTPLRARTNIARDIPPPQAAPTPRPEIRTYARENTALVTPQHPLLSPRSLEGGSVDPATGMPEREVIGIGAMVARENEILRIKGVLPGSPAEDANLSGCTIQSINGVDVTTMPLQECVRLIRGLEGSTVTLDVIDPDEQRQTVQIVPQEDSSVNG